jgi:hypothetical protein
MIKETCSTCNIDELIKEIIKCIKTNKIHQIQSTDDIINKIIVEAIYYDEINNDYEIFNYNKTYFDIRLSLKKKFKYKYSNLFHIFDNWSYHLKSITTPEKVYNDIKDKFTEFINIY